MAAMARETNSWRWPLFAFGYMLTLAYGLAYVAHGVVAALV
jgi:ferrous iron transport protein B